MTATTNRYHHSGLPWTPDEVEELRRLVADGLSNAEIAERIGRTVATITWKSSVEGIRRSGLPRQNGNLEPVPPAPTMVTGSQFPPSSGQIATVQRNLDAGREPAEIAAIMGQTEAWVNNAIANHHLVAAPPRNTYRAHLPEPAPIAIPSVRPSPYRRSNDGRKPEPEPVPPPVIMAMHNCAVCGARFAWLPGESELCNACEDAAEQALGEDDPVDVPARDALLNDPIDDAPEPSVDTASPINQSAETAPDRQPSDVAADLLAGFERFSGRQGTVLIAGIVVVLRKGPELALSREADQALGFPARAQVLFDRTGRRIAIQPTTEKSGYRLTGAPGEGMRAIAAGGFARWAGIEFSGQRLPATIEGGVLIVVLP